MSCLSCLGVPCVLVVVQQPKSFSFPPFPNRGERVNIYQVYAAPPVHNFIIAIYIRHIRDPFLDVGVFNLRKNEMSNEQAEIGRPTSNHVQDPRRHKLHTRPRGADGPPVGAKNALGPYAARPLRLTHLK